MGDLHGDDEPELTTEQAFAGLGPELNLVALEADWGVDSVDWLITALSLVETPAAELEHRRALAGTGVAPVVGLPSTHIAAAHRQDGVLRAA